MRFVLDTDSCICAMKRQGAVLEHMLSRSRSELAVSVITEAELRTGAAKSSAPGKTLRLVEGFLRPLALLEFTSQDAASYALIRSRLERAGKPIGPLDTLIAAQALARRLVVVTNNDRELRRVPALRVENWST